jgi:HEAT repeats
LQAEPLVLSIPAFAEGGSADQDSPLIRPVLVVSRAFERFRFSFFEDNNSARDGLATTALGELRGDERARAEDMLLDHLPDTRAVIGLGVLRVRRAEPLLVPLFEAERREKGSGLTYLARALCRIRPDPRWRAALIDVLSSAEFYIQRMDAAIGLRDVHDAGVVPALVAALEDPESLVRYHAAYTLLALHGVPVDALNPPEMLYRAMADDPARREGGKRDLLAAIAGRQIIP